ncbi:MAG: ankyrin repeat domain-containing protein [Blastocatellales bacterium]
MNPKYFTALPVALTMLLWASLNQFTMVTLAQIPGQLAEDFVAGSVPSSADIARLEAAVTARPDDFRLTRKLAKAYFFQYYGEGRADAFPKAEKALERALVLRKDDPETLAYLGSLYAVRAERAGKRNAAQQKADFDRAFALLRQAEQLAPRDGAVLSITSGSYVMLPESYGMTSHVVEMLEGMRRGMGPQFKRFSHHGQQRLLLTLGQAYARTGQPAKARARFDEALQVNGESVEAALIKTELSKLPKVPSGSAEAQAQLWEAAQTGNLANAQGALKAGADLNTLDTRANQNGRTALNYAAEKNHAAMIQWLVEHGAKVNRANNTGFTPLHHAAESGSLAAAEMLLKLGADLKATNRRGATPLAVAKRWGKTEVANLLEKAGGV